LRTHFGNCGFPLQHRFYLRCVMFALNFKTHRQTDLSCRVQYDGRKLEFCMQFVFLDITLLGCPPSAPPPPPPPKSRRDMSETRTSAFSNFFFCLLLLLSHVHEFLSSFGCHSNLVSKSRTTGSIHPPAV